MLLVLVLLALVLPAPVLPVISTAFTLFCREFGNVVNHAFLVLIFWAENLVGAIFSAFCNYANTIHKQGQTNIFKDYDEAKIPKLGLKPQMHFVEEIIRQ